MNLMIQLQIKKYPKLFREILTPQQHLVKLMIILGFYVLKLKNLLGKKINLQIKNNNQMKFRNFKNHNKKVWTVKIHVNNLKIQTTF